MNKLLKISIGLALCVMVSCVNEKPSPDVPSEEQSEMDIITAMNITPLEGINLLWENKDCIALRSQENATEEPSLCMYTTALAAPKGVATFKRTAGTASIPNKISDRYIALYPGSLDYMAWAKEPYVVVAPNSEQVIRNKKIDRSSMIMIASSDDAEFTFHHVLSYVKFTVTADTSPFNKVTVSSGDESQYMVSPVRVDFDDSFTYTLDGMELLGKANKQVSFATADGSNFSQGTYYIAINPDSYAKGIKLTFENAYECIVIENYPGPYKTRPGEVIDVGEIGYLDFQTTLPHVGIYKKDNVKLGVTFYVDPRDPGKRKVVSASSILTQWASSNEKWRITGSKEDYDYVHTIVTSSDRYIDNPNDFPAVQFCDQMRQDYGGNWHVPSLSELNMLFNAYYGKQSDNALTESLEYSDAKSMLAAECFDTLLESAGGERMLAQTNEYWTCGQNTNGNLQFVNMQRYHNGNDSQLKPRYVRCVRDVDDNVPDDAIVYPQTNVGKLFKGNLSSRIVDVLWDTTYNVTQGLDYYQLQIITDAQEKLDAYLLRCDMSKGLDVKTLISTETTSSTWHLQNLRDMAAGVSTDKNPVYAIVNADFSDKRPPIRPRGPVHCNGNVWCSTFSLDPEYTHQGLSYIGMTHDGKMTIGLREDYESAKSSLKECTGAGYILVEDFKIVGRGSTSRDPRTAIGYTSNNIIWILAVDGRHKGTEGITYSEMSTIFFDIGCEAAVNMDGGGSTQMLTRNQYTGELVMRNWPSDPTDGEGGQERPRLNAWAIVKK